MSGRPADTVVGYFIKVGGLNSRNNRQMEKRMPRLLIAFTLLLTMAGTAHAQSLAAVARKEEARRKEIAKPSRVLTNKDLKPGEVPSSSPAAAAPGGQQTTAPAEDAGPKSDEDRTPAADSTAGDAGDEQAWRKKMADSRTTLDRSKSYMDALQSKINGLWAEFTSRDDPAQRALIDAERKKALAELDRVKSDVELQKKAIADLEEQARQQNVPAGWLR